MHYKRLQKYGKKLAVAVLTSAVLLASGATVYADDTGEYLSQANTQEAEVTESTEDVATPAESESGEVESTTRNQEEQKNKATESEIQEEGKIILSPIPPHREVLMALLIEIPKRVRFAIMKHTSQIHETPMGLIE